MVNQIGRDVGVIFHHNAVVLMHNRQQFILAQVGFHGHVHLFLQHVEANFVNRIAN